MEWTELVWNLAKLVFAGFVLWLLARDDRA